MNAIMQQTSWFEIIKIIVFLEFSKPLFVNNDTDTVAF